MLSRPKSTVIITAYHEAGKEKIRLFYSNGNARIDPDVNGYGQTCV